MSADYRSSYNGKKILVTGGAGAIGSTLVCNLCATDAAMVIVLDDLASGQRWNLPPASNMMFVEGSVLDEVKLKRVFFEEPQIVFHLAAFFANQNSIDHPEHDLMTNGMGTLRLLEYSKLTKIERFIYASSGCSIYGSSAPLPLREEFMS
ncbi:MAG: NAD-dependent epimerase/dehydratase family protein, partial [Ignavibacteriales bacterium]|nr:NAD-dependent epimerase/dehydratase family protein [Ignavibacteriales bacterium]